METKKHFVRKKPFIINRPSELEYHLYLQKEFEFVLAVINKDIMALNHLLSDDGCFFGKYNKWQTLKFFKNQFDKWEPEQTTLNIPDYNAVDRNFGKKAIMIDQGKFPISRKTKQPKTFILTVKNEQIIKIQLCWKFISSKQILELCKNN